MAGSCQTLKAFNFLVYGYISERRKGDFCRSLLGHFCQSVTECINDQFEAV
jgi:hypothetical protein